MLHDRRVVRAEPEKVDARVARLAAGQWSVLSVGELYRCGLSDDAILTRVQNGRLFRRHRGVYILGHPNIPDEAEWLAAVKACGPDAVLSHFSAAALWGLLKWDGRFPEVTAPKPRRHPGIKTHRSSNVERTYRKGIPVTPVLRVLIDLAGSRLSDLYLRRAVNEALAQRLIKPHEIITTHHRGAKRLRRLLAEAAPTRNEYEDAVNALLKGLPRAEINQRLGGYVPDFCWPEHKVILEADSKQFHEHILARARDRAKDAALEADGWLVIRITWHQLVTEPLAVRKRVEAAVTARASTFSG
jgi:very-short-patch-repair endonuclease